MTEPQTAVAPAYTPIVTDISRLARVLLSPTAVFEEQKDAPTFWTPWAIMAVLLGAVNIFMRPFQQRVRELMLQRLGQPVHEPTVAQLAVGIVVGVAVLLLVCLIGAGIMYAVVALFGGETSYKKMLTIAAFVLPITLIIQIVTMAVLYSRGLGSVNGPEDLIVSLGLDLLLPQSVQPSYFVRFMLAGLNLLAIWQLAITAMGLTVLAKMSKGGAWTAAIVNFLVVLVLMSGLGALGMKMAGG